MKKLLLLSTNIKRNLLFFFVVFTISNCIAQNPADVNLAFPNNAFNSTILCSALQSDGKIIIGGAFTTYNNISINYIYRLNTDGTPDNSFITVTGFNNTVNAIAIQADGKILVGGNFTSFNGNISNRIIRLNTDGTLDSSFSSSSGFNDYVNTIALQADGKILVGGNFTTYNSTSSNRIIRLNINGSIDASFNIGIGFNNVVNVISIQTDGKILIGGDFTGYYTALNNNLLRMIRLNTNGTLDTSFNGAKFSTYSNQIAKVNSIAIQSDGKILVGGIFSFFNGVSTGNIIRLNTDGTKDTTFSAGASDNINIIKIQYDGKIIVGGNFTSFNGYQNSANHIVRIDSTGNTDTTFNTGTGFDDYVKTFAIQPDGRIVVGGNFTTYNNATTNFFIRLNLDASVDKSFNIGTGFNGPINTIALQTDGKILAGGFFTNYNGSTSNRIIRMFTDRTQDPGFNTTAGFGNEVKNISIINDGSILVGGAFGVVRLDAYANTSNPLGFPALNNFVSTIAIQPDGKSLLGGAFTSTVSQFNSISANRIVRLNTSLNIENTSSFYYGTGFDNTVNAIAIQSDGKILVGGDFINYNSIVATRLIRLNSNGSKDSSFITGAYFPNFTSFNATVKTIVIQPDGKILVGGDFNVFNGSLTNYIIRLNSDGSKDTSFSIGAGFNNSVNSIALQSNGKILIGGTFTSYNGVVANHIVCLNVNGTQDLTFNSGTGFDGNVNTIVLQPDGKIWIGGNFSQYNGVYSGNIICLKGNSVLGNETFNIHNEATIFPNPVNEILNISLAKQNETIDGIEIFSLEGRLVLQKKEINNSNSAVEVSSLPQGIYICKIISGNVFKTIKFLKQ